MAHPEHSSEPTEQESDLTEQDIHKAVVGLMMSVVELQQAHAQGMTLPFGSSEPFARQYLTNTSMLAIRGSNIVIHNELDHRAIPHTTVEPATGETVQVEIFRWTAGSPPDKVSDPTGSQGNDLPHVSFQQLQEIYTALSRNTPPNQE